MKLFLPLIGILTILTLDGCKKKVEEFDWRIHGRYGYVDTANFLILAANNHLEVNDTASGSIGRVSFIVKYPYLSGDSIVTGQRSISLFDRIFSRSPRFIVRYIGGEPLIDRDSISINDDFSADFQINKNLLGKEIFQVYDTETRRMYLNLWASPKGVSIKTWTIGTTDYKRVADSYNHYLNSIYNKDSSLFGN